MKTTTCIILSFLFLTGCGLSGEGQGPDPANEAGPAAPTQPPAEQGEELGAAGQFIAPTTETQPPAPATLDDLLDEHGGRAAFMFPAEGDLANLPQDPNNPLTPAKVELGMFLFHETGLATNPQRPEGYGTYSCATCHHAAAGFQAGVTQAIGEGGQGFDERTPLPDYDEGELDVQGIRTTSIVAAGYQEALLWSGSLGGIALNEPHRSYWSGDGPTRHNRLGFEGMETQAIAGMGLHRLSFERSELTEDVTYLAMFDEAYPELMPSQRATDTNAALAIAAYERTIVATRSPWQRWLAGDEDAMTARQLQGARVFFGEAKCVDCHTGPALSSMTFWALGFKDLKAIGPKAPDRLGRGAFTHRDEDLYRFKTPQLYNLKDSPFYGHGASFTSLRDVIVYKNNAVPENYWVPAANISPEFEPLGLTDEQIDALTVFVEDALHDPELDRFSPPALPSGRCFPSADHDAMVELGCEQ